jgi:hypothetical protein
MKKIVLICSVSLLALGACNMNAVKGNGHVITKSFVQKGFKDIEASSELEIHLIQGPEYNIKIEGEENIIQLMDIKMEGDVLKVGLKDHVSINTSHPLKVFITAPEFREIEGSGACSFTTDGTLTSTSDIKLDLSGACELRMNIDAAKIEVDASGATEINIKGKARDFSVDASGASSIHCYDLLTENTTLEISGGGDAEVFASRLLTVSISGAGDVKYKGNPASVKQDISGAGEVTKVN